MIDRSVKTIIVSVATTAIIIAGVMLVLMRYGSGFLRKSDEPQQAPPQFARMGLQAQYAGPLEGTVIQRWQDPVDGTICYIYLPMVVHHEAAPSGYMDYGSNSVGALSCLRPPIPQVANPPAAAPQ